MKAFVVVCLCGLSSVNAWTSHYQSGGMYRAFHDKKCYELGIQEIDASVGAYDPGTIKEFTKRDAEEVRVRLAAR